MAKKKQVRKARKSVVKRKKISPALKSKRAKAGWKKRQLAQKKLKAATEKTKPILDGTSLTGNNAPTPAVTASEKPKLWSFKAASRDDINHRLNIEVAKIMTGLNGGPGFEVGPSGCAVEIEILSQRICDLMMGFGTSHNHKNPA